MNFNEILNSVIAGLMCSITVAGASFSYKFVRKKYEEDNLLFGLNFSFYLGIFSLIFSCIGFDFKVPLNNLHSIDSWLNLSFLVCIFINLRTIFVSYKNVKDFIRDCQSNSKK